MKESWFTSLLRMDNVQQAIDQKECYSLYTDHTGNLIEIQKRNGRPPISWKIVNDILALYDQDRDLVVRGMKNKNLSYRSLAKLLDDPVSYQTVRAIVKKYRSKGEACQELSSHLVEEKQVHGVQTGH
jgi:hypothetical protein